MEGAHRDLMVYEAGHRLLQFVFPSVETRANVYQKQPWCFKSHVLSLIPWETPSHDVYDRLQFMPITIQLTDLPPHCNTVGFSKTLLAPLGEVVTADIYTPRPHGQGRPFLKVIVKMDLLASFPGKIEAAVEDDAPFEVFLRYEDLPAICFLCGILGH
ncbi:hypothetical protein LINGRAHAP2_LOCUS14071 [Linum grandiflorum]